MEKKDMSPLEEVLEYTKQKVQEGKENVDETLEEEARRIQDIIEFAKSRIDEVSEDAKTILNEVIAFAESKLEHIEKEIAEAKESAQELVEVVVKEGEEIQEKIEKSGITDTVVSAAKTAGNMLADLGKKIGKETKQFTEITSLQWEIRSLEKSREEKFTQLGGLLYGLYRTGEKELSLAPELGEILTEVKEIDEKIVEKRNAVERIRKEEDISPEEFEKIDEAIVEKMEKQ